MILEEVVDMIISKDDSGFLNGLKITDDITILALEHTAAMAKG